MSYNTQQFITAVKTAALKAETFSECDRLIEWTLDNLPYVGHGETDHSLFNALYDMCHYWKAFGCAEDELLPALSLVHLFFAYGHTLKGDFELLAQRTARCDAMIAEPNMEEHWTSYEEHWTSYEEFCDKYAEYLN